MTNKKSTRIKRIPGDVVIIDLGSEYHSYGRVLESTIGFYDVKTQDELGIEEIIQYPNFF